MCVRACVHECMSLCVCVCDEVMTAPPTDLDLASAGEPSAVGMSQTDGVGVASSPHGSHYINITPQLLLHFHRQTDRYHTGEPSSHTHTRPPCEDEEFCLCVSIQIILRVSTACTSPATDWIVFSSIPDSKQTEFMNQTDSCCGNIKKKYI